MIILTKKKIFNINLFYIINLGLYSFLVNFYYSKLGSFPIDTFLHYDSAYRILTGDLPIKDYWIVSGLTVDFIQSLFFKIFGTSWFAYSLHSSVFNLVITISAYLFFIKINLKKYKAFLFSICLATLSYTISGTPFVDLHATYFLLLATLIIMININNNNQYLWVIVTFLFFLSFFSKQVPASYAAVANFFILLFYFIFNRYFRNIFTIFASSTVVVISIFIFLKLYDIDFENFYIQYFDYPISIGQSRFIEISFVDFFNKFKFIILPLIFVTILKIKKNKDNIFSDEIVSFIIFLIFSIILIFHQVMSKNQIYIYFLIPIIFGLLEIEIIKSKIKFKKYVSIILIFTLIFITLKYHLRYNENRKFHELNKTQLNETSDTGKIHKSLIGNKWINPSYDGNSSDEIEILSKVQNKLNNDFEDKIMIISNYLFLDSITKKKLNGPNRTFTIDGNSIPIPGSKHFEYYKSYLQKKIIKKNINQIIFIKHENIPKEIISNYIGKECYNTKDGEIFYIMELKCLN
tara:strand:- start:2655 stop:4214 length:1560 start_codon:yes stop_codon:yes gene_type:complete